MYYCVCITVRFSDYTFLLLNKAGQPWYSGSTLDYWQTGRAIDLAPGALFVTKFISFAQLTPAQYSLYSAESWPKTPIISFQLLLLHALHSIAVNFHPVLDLCMN